MKTSYSPAFKAQIVRELLKEEKPINQLAAEHGLHPNQLYRWREIALTAFQACSHANGQKGAEPPLNLVR